MASSYYFVCTGCVQNAPGPSGGRLLWLHLDNVGEVDLVEIDRLDAKACGRGPGRVHHVRRLLAPRHRRELGGERDGRARLCDAVREQFLGATEAVRLGRIEKGHSVVDACLQRSCSRRIRLLIEWPVERTHAHLGHAQGAQLHSF